uniref:Uncharacterized protein n=1 Tax=Lotharella globosa TaxID=91324 RepID=A0A7S4DR44_9EUKA
MGCSSSLSESPLGSPRAREANRILRRNERLRARRDARVDRERKKRIKMKKNAMVTRAQLRIEAGFHVDARDEYGHTMLIKAARFDNLALAELMVRKKATVDLRDTKGITALMWAARWGNLSIVRFLVEQGNARVSTNDTDESHGPTALMFAAKEGQIEVVRYLVQARASVNTRTIAEGTTAVLMAAGSNRVEVLDFLLGDKAQASLQPDHEGTTPLIAASKRRYSKNLDAVGYLLDVVGVDVNETDHNKRSALMHACMRENSEGLLERLLEAKACVHSRDRYGATALDLAVVQGKCEQPQVRMLQQRQDEVRAVRYLKHGVLVLVLVLPACARVSPLRTCQPLASHLHTCRNQNVVSLNQ